MKVISAHHEKIARVNCSCCGDDEHFVDIFFNKRYGEPPLDPDDYLFEFEFDIKNDRWMFPPLKRRIQEARALLKNEDNYRNEEYVDCILLEPEQLLDIYEVVREYADKVLTEAEQKLIDVPVKPEFIKWYIKFKRSSKNDWVEIFFFRGEDGLTVYLDHFEDDEKPETKNKVWIHDAGIGWFIPARTLPEYIRRYALGWLLKRSATGMRHMYCSLTKAETIRFLAALNYIFTNVEKDEKGHSCITI
jgi:hypothetical protein